MDYKPNIGRTGFHFVVLGIIFTILCGGGLLLASGNPQLQYFMRQFNFIGAALTIVIFLMIFAFLFSLVSLLSKERSKRDVITMALSVVLGMGIFLNMEKLIQLLY